MAGDPPALSVSGAVALAKGALEQVRVRVVGEITDATIRSGYKAVYFKLKDDTAVMPCLMWRDAYDRSGVELADGRMAEVAGFFTAYPAKGQLQFQVRSLTLAGEGMLRMQVAALARRLEAEGLMRDDRKRALPEYPQRIALVTSPRGKAVHDVIRTLRRRYPVAELLIAGVQVEGDGAVSALVDGIEAAGRASGVDAVILARGGGSYEDLMPFNTEEVARAVVSCPVPVVTGIGHEPDTTIADMVADVRASTPTAAAEAVSPDVSDLSRRLDAQTRLLGRGLEHVVATQRHRLAVMASRPVFRDASALLAAHTQAVDSAADGLSRGVATQLARQRESMGREAERLLRVGARLFEPHARRFTDARDGMAGAGERVTHEAERAVAGYAARLQDLSPLAILGRGYAVCYSEDGTVVRAARDVAIGDRISVRLGQGRLACLVEGTGSEE